MGNGQFGRNLVRGGGRRYLAVGMATLIGSMLATSAASASVVRPLGHAGRTTAASDGPLSLVPPRPLTQVKRGYQITIPVSVSDPQGDNSVITVTTVKGTSAFARPISNEERDKICGNSAPAAQPADGITCSFGVGARTFNVPVKLMSNVECGKQVPVLDWTGQHRSAKEGSTYYEIEADAIVGEAVVTVGCPGTSPSAITSRGVRTGGCPTPSTITGKGARITGCTCPSRTVSRGVGITNCAYLRPRGSVQTGGGGMALRELPLKHRAAREHYLLTGAKARKAQHRS